MKLLRRKRTARCQNCGEDIEPCAVKTCVREPAFVHVHTGSHGCKIERFAVATPQPAAGPEIIPVKPHTGHW